MPTRSAPAVRAARTRGPVATLVFVALVAGLGAGCVPAPAGPSAAPASPGYVRAIRADEVDLWRGQNYRGLLLDVRNADEWDDTPGLLEGARRVPLPELESRLDELAAFRGGPVLVIDTSGPRASAAAQVLSREGFRDVAWLDGGIDAYRRAQESP